MSLSVADRLYLLKRGTQARIAKAEGCSTAYVSRVVNGKVLPSTQAAALRMARVRAAVARELGVPMDQAFGD